MHLPDFAKGPSGLHTEFDNEIFEQLAGLFVGEEILSDLPPAPLDCDKLDFSFESLETVDGFLAAVHERPGDDEQMFKVVLRAGSYLGEVLRRNAGRQLDWVQYDRASELIEGLTNGFGKHPATMAILVADDGGCTFALGKVSKFLQEGSGDSTLFFANAMLHQWSQPDA